MSFPSITPDGNAAAVPSGFLRWFMRVTAALLIKPLIAAYRVADRIFHLNKRGADRNLAKLLREVHSHYDFLFTKYGCRVVHEESHGDPSMDHAIVVIDARAFRLRAARDRGDTLWSIVRVDNPQSWRPIEDVFRATESDLSVLYETAPMLDKHFADIEPFLAAVPSKQ